MQAHNVQEKVHNKDLRHGLQGHQTSLVVIEKTWSCGKRGVKNRKIFTNWNTNWKPQIIPHSCS